MNYTAFLFAALLLAGCSPSERGRGVAAGWGSPVFAHAPAAKRLSVKSADVAGQWVMTIVIGTRTFEDRVTLVRDAGGQLGGDLEVVGLWKAPLERVSVAGDQLSFELVAPEKEPFRVRYAGTVGPDGRTFVGLATLPDEGGQTMGAFKAIRL